MLKAHEEHKKRLQECDMLEKHIIQARARATSADERALSQAANNTSTAKYLQLGLPHVSSNFRWCLDEETLKKHDLIVPSDFYPKSKPLVDGPKGEKIKFSFLFCICKVLVVSYVDLDYV